MKILQIIFFFLFLLALSSCMPKPTLYSYRSCPTEFQDDDVAVLLFYRYCDCVPNPKLDGTFEEIIAEECSVGACTSSVSKGDDLEQYIMYLILQNRPKFKVSTSKKIRDCFEGGSTSPETVVQRLANDSFFSRLNSSHPIKYIIVLESHDLTSKGKVVWGAHQGGGWGIGREWVKSSRVSATIIDVAQKKKAGFVSSVSTGEKGFMVPFVLIFPLPPIPWSSITMTPACEGLVKELLDFIQGKSVHLG